MNRSQTLVSESSFWDLGVRGILFASVCYSLALLAVDTAIRIITASQNNSIWKVLLEVLVIAPLVGLFAVFSLVIPTYLLAILVNSTLKSLAINPIKLWVAGAVGGLVPVSLFLLLLRTCYPGAMSCYADPYSETPLDLIVILGASLFLQAGAIAGVRSVVRSESNTAPKLGFHLDRFVMNLVWIAIVVASSLAIALSKGYTQAEVNEFVIKWLGGQLVTLLLIISAEYFYTNFLLIKLDTGEETGNLTPTD